MPTSSVMGDRKRRRALGAFYTPREIVRFMLRSCVTALTESDGNPLTVLDPACGDGAFLIGAATAFSEITRIGWQGQKRSGWPWDSTSLGAGPSASLLTPAPGVELQQACSDGPLNSDGPLKLYGVDVDASAIEALRRQLEQESARFAARIVQGDALTGPAFGENADGESAGLDWSQAFPDVAARGGFDLVIGNPPYLREKDAKALFDCIAESPLGKRWRQPRMDLWHYFLHRGLDLLKPGGVLSFIVNSYWTSATGARRLIERLRDETTIERIVLLGEAPIFTGVAGRHMILQLRKGRRESDCRVLDLTASADVLAILDRLADAHEDVGTPDTMAEWSQSQSSLYDGGRLILARQSSTKPRAIGARPLGQQYVVRQGIVENPPLVTRAMCEESGGSQQIGTGVFVLTRDETQALRLSTHEQTLLRPYFATASLGRYVLPHEPTHWLLYFTPQTAPDITALPVLRRHLERFRKTLERRREVRNGSIGWWHLHWPRREMLFTQPRILVVQMGRRPSFVFAERPTFVGFSVNVVQRDADEERRSFSLPALTAILNSSPAGQWFAQHAKRRGVNLDISGTVLRDFPVPRFDESADEALRHLCLQRQSAGIGGVDSTNVRSIEGAIDCLAGRLYETAAAPAVALPR